MKLTLPIPPSVNHMYVGPKRAMDAKARAWFTEAGLLTRKQCVDQGWGMTKEAWLYADMKFYMPDLRRRDSHNTIKILLDVMEGFVYENDFYVMPRIQLVGHDKENPRVEIEFSEA
ncbi:MAG: RusA family crossover junction endodeoxyribonuclease [Candidatus Izemoplasmatales bacterium]|jgi:crossover junction endodeoxyribonuclease RusA|nr:RusA family crossover junction endodeoxyribonuclease [Candidatus Izemoplasmatales bacterium]